MGKTSTEIIYGASPVIESLRAGRRACHEVLISLGRKESLASKVAELAKDRGAPVRYVAKEEIAKAADTPKHQGVAARVDPYPYVELEELVRSAVADPRKAFLLVLDGITDPHNLGSLMRTAHLMGVHGIVMPRDNQALVTPVAVKSSAGASEYLPTARVTNLARTLGYLKEEGIWIAGLAAPGEKTIYDNNFKGLNIAIVLGSEGKGLRRLIKEACDFLLFIPMEGEILSYNVSVAGALAMAEVVRQRRSS